MPSRAAQPALGEDASTQHQSLALQLLTERFGNGSRHRVLDLGPANSGNVAFFSRLSCSLQIADLHQTLFPANSPRPTLSDEAFDQLLARDLLPNEKVDLVLSWDLLNYLDPRKIALLSDRLKGFCRDGTLLFALISTRKEVPDRPCRFEVLTDALLGYDLESQFQRPSPRYKEPQLARSLGRFTVDTSFLLRNGMQEYLFTYSTTS